MDRSKNSRLTLVVALVAMLYPPLAIGAEDEPSHTGVYYGYLIDVRPDYSSVTARAAEKGVKRRRFYLDKQTKVYVDGKRKPRTELYCSDKVAIRYFGKGDLLVADAIYVVFGDFEPKDYVPKKQLVVIKKEEQKKESAH